ncbi:hypothetical protein AAU57_12945 [Nonlabens sp. YIK11]|uniref:hypothetical protein n=1 Tax=Nonlabens sp. YIK11 TaxID=1453349 RepID=UPI0006DD1354|nr:hypothetical protein [Nonlabens sp. YIK11]KQC34138.1 hypothetical protein AAU57_12945 [Nonlabens sp. YIK11]
MQSHQDIHDYIIAIESDFPVDTWVIDGIHVWPYLRIKIYYALIHQVEGISADEINTITQDKVGGLRSYKLKLGELFYYLKSILSSRRQPVIFATLALYRINYNGTLFHKFFDAMIQSNQLEQKVEIVEIQGSTSGCYNQAAIIDGIRLRNGYRVRQKLLNWLSINEKPSETFYVPQYDLFLERLISDGWIDIENNLESHSIIKWAQKVKFTSKVYRELFTKRNTKRFVTISYYGFDDMAAALFAANALGIETIDFQHGPQTNVHMAYSSWTKIPANGFNTMPKFYWNWDERSKNNIQSWLKKPNASKKVGHPWLAMTQEKKSFGENRDFLYTLQLINHSNITYFFPEQLLKVMKRERYSWILRVHPRNTVAVDLIDAFLESKKVPKNNYAIELPSARSLASSLNACRVHITNYSGCVLEASMLNRKSVVIDKTGYQFYKNYIDDVSIYFVDKQRPDFSTVLMDIHAISSFNEKNVKLEIFDPFTGL